MTTSEITISTEDGVPLAATLYESLTGNGRVVLVNSAMAVKRGYYHKFATFLANSGFHVLTYDYRGIGSSRPQHLRGYPATLLDWGAHDQAAMIGWLHAHYPSQKLLVVGHSVGGQILGLTAENKHISAALGVAAQSGYWRLWPGVLLKLRMLAVWYVLVPGLAGMFGYFPGSVLGFGEDVPTGVALEWARGGRRPHYILSLYGQTKYDHFASFAAPLQFYSFSDDHYAPRETVEALLKFYPHANASHQHVRPTDLGVKTIGHFGFFRSAFESSLWTQARDWLLHQ